MLLVAKRADHLVILHLQAAKLAKVVAAWQDHGPLEQLVEPLVAGSTLKGRNHR